MLAQFICCCNCCGVWVCIRWAGRTSAIDDFDVGAMQDDVAVCGGCVAKMNTHKFVFIEFDALSLGVILQPEQA